MEKRIIELDKIPDRQSIKSVLGMNIFECYESFCSILISLFPKNETWAGRSRRGMFFHGFNEFPKTDLKYVYMWISANTLNCELHFSKRKYDSIVRTQNAFSDEMREFIAGSISTYLCFSLTEKTLCDVITIIAPTKYVANKQHTA